MGQSFLLAAHMDYSAVKTITMGLCLLENHPACTSVVNCLYDYQKDTAGFFVQSWKEVRNNFYTYIFFLWQYFTLQASRIILDQIDP